MERLRLRTTQRIAPCLTAQQGSAVWIYPKRGDANGGGHENGGILQSSSKGKSKDHWSDQGGGAYAAQQRMPLGEAPRIEKILVLKFAWIFGTIYC